MKAVETIIYIWLFEQKWVLLKEALQWEQPTQNMVTIVLYQSVSNKALYKNRHLENIKKLYKLTVKCDDQQKYEVIIKSSKVYTT